MTIAINPHSTVSSSVVLFSEKGPTAPQIFTHLDKRSVPKFFGKVGGFTNRSYLTYSFLYRHKGKKKRGRKNYPPLKPNSSPRPSKPIIFTEAYGKPFRNSLKSWIDHVTERAGVRDRDVA